MVRSLLCIGPLPIDVLLCTTKSFYLANYAGLKILLIFFHGIVFSTLMDPQTSFWMQSMMPWFPYLHDHRHCYVQLPRLDSAQAGAQFLVGEVLVSCTWSACWLQCADKWPWWLPDIQRKILHTTESYKDDITRILWCTWSFWPDTHMQEMTLEQFYWPQMTHNIWEYCRNCYTYQHFKSDTQKVAGLYAPLTIPD